jgi:hypothetical protein
MVLKELDLLNTNEYGSYILPNMYHYYAEAAAICFEENNFTGKTALKIEGEQSSQFNLNWKVVSQQVKDMHNDLVDKTEYGAYCIAFLIVHHLTDYKVIRRSKRKTGFDYWLGDKESEYPFEDTARLEVSGILKGANADIKRRLKEKIAQITPSNEDGLPAYIVVTEFSKPISNILLIDEQGQ